MYWCVCDGILFECGGYSMFSHSIIVAHGYTDRYSNINTKSVSYGDSN